MPTDSSAGSASSELHAPQCFRSLFASFFGTRKKGTRAAGPGSPTRKRGKQPPSLTRRATRGLSIFCDHLPCRRNTTAAGRRPGTSEHFGINVNNEMSATPSRGWPDSVVRSSDAPPSENS